MSSTDQTLEISNSLKEITSIFKKCNANYRIVGSVLISAYKNSLFRHIGDIDIVLQEDKQELVFGKLEEAGFTLMKRRWFNFYWYESKKDNYLGFTFLLVGEFKQNYFKYQIAPFIELHFQNQYIYPTEYSLFGITFIGIPLSSVVAGIQHSLLNPKRKKDQEVMKEEISKFKTEHASNQIKVYIAGLQIPYLYEIFSIIYNIYGGIRVKFGKTYETW